jgi:hypothetical protein
MGDAVRRRRPRRDGRAAGAEAGTAERRRTAAAIRRMGVPTPGAPRLAGEPEFSIASFAANWNRLSARAKDMLFGEDTPGSNRAALEALARAVNAQRNVLHLAGQSPTGEINAMLTALATLVDGFMRGGRTPEMAAGGAVIAGSYGLARLLMSPAFTRWMFRLPRILREGNSPQHAAQILLRALGASGGATARPRVGDTGPQGGVVTGVGSGTQ